MYAFIVPALIRSKEFRKRISVKEGRNLTEICRAVGVPTPEMVWTHTGTGNTKISATTLNLPLKIVNVGSQHAGRYICTATNQFGSDQQNLEVTIKESKKPLEYFHLISKHGFDKVLGSIPTHATNDGLTHT